MTTNNEIPSGNWINKDERDFWNLFYKWKEAKVVREWTGWMGNPEKAKEELDEFLKQRNERKDNN